MINRRKNFSLVIMIVTGIALIIPDFTTFLDIMGAIAAGTVAFILPPLLYNEQFKDTISPSLKYAHWGLVLFGVIGSILSLATSIAGIINGD